jgi:hypothetical protein
MADEKEALNKKDLFLLLESYKNSVEMNTLISQQLTTILDALGSNKADLIAFEAALDGKLDKASNDCEKVREVMQTHDKESLKSHSKIFNKINLLYVGIGSIVISLFGLVYMIIIKNSALVHLITTHMGKP